MSVLLRILAVLVAVTVAGTTLPGLTSSSAADSTGASPAAQTAQERAAAQPLHGLTIALDPGHQLGNSHYPRQINRPVPAGGFKKPCNTTGAATNSGVPEATVNFRLSNAVKSRLVALGARVRMTRTTNSASKWGPCVDVRGRFGKRVGASLMVSLHADGAPSNDHGFHVIAPTRRKPWTTDIAASSLRLAKSLRNSLTHGGIARSNYIGGGTGIDIRSDLGTLNMSDVPVAMIETGNMRNSGDAHRMTTAKGRARYANAVVQGIRTYLQR
jgi:N-acetylmuramoyl-L-alanine amidase